MEFVLKQSTNPLHQINDVEEDVVQFFHLSGMDSFVIEHYIVNVTIRASDKQNAEEIDCQESLKWDEIVIDNFHV